MRSTKTSRARQRRVDSHKHKLFYFCYTLFYSFLLFIHLLSGEQCINCHLIWPCTINPFTPIHTPSFILSNFEQQILHCTFLFFPIWSHPLKHHLHHPHHHPHHCISDHLVFVCHCHGYLLSWWWRRSSTTHFTSHFSQSSAASFINLTFESLHSIL